MILNSYEESVISKTNLPSAWQSQKILGELEEFLQNNWEQRAVFYEDGKVESRQQFLDLPDVKLFVRKNILGRLYLKASN